MYKKIFLLLGLILLCNGCVSVTDTGSGKKTDTVVPVKKVVKPVVHGTFAPAYKSALKDPYREAGKIYRSSPKPVQGIYPYNGLVFVVVCIDTSVEKIRYREGTAMLRTVAMLRRHYTGLGQKFYAPNRVLEKGFDGDNEKIYRYVSVFREQQIKRNIKK